MSGRGRETREKPPEPTGNREVALATTWLPRIGGALLLTGAALAAALALPRLGPSAKLFSGFGLAGALAVSAFLVRLRAERLAQVLAVIGAAMAYFMSFAGHYIPATRVDWMPAGLSLVMMVGFAGCMFAMSERWQSQGLAIFGFGLGILAALLSARSSQAFALVALGILALNAGIMMIRHEWKLLNIVALLLTYLATLGLWIIQPIEPVVGEVSAHLGALIFYHLIFTGAFLRWSRPWLARESAIRQASEHDAIPAYTPQELPFSTGYSILNSLGLISLSLWLFWQTRIFWPQVHVLLYVLTVSEACRLLIPWVRRNVLGAFHVLTAFSLLCAGTVSATSGLTESAVLAMEALILAVAASRVPFLRLLRPLTAICAFLTVASFRFATPATLPGLVAALVPGALLMASTLPWESIGVRIARPWAGTPLRVLEVISGQLRALTGGAMLVVTLMNYFTPSRVQSTVLGVVLVSWLVGMILLRAHSWFLAVAGATCALLAFVVSRTANPGDAVRYAAWLFFAGLLWQEYARRAHMRIARAGLTVWFVFFLFPTVVSAHHVSQWAEPFQGLTMGAYAALLFVAGTWARRNALLRPLVPAATGEAPEDSSWSARLDDPSVSGASPIPWWNSTALLLGLAIGTVALVQAALVDAQKHLWSALALSLPLLAVWVVRVRRGALAPIMHSLLSGVPLATLAVALLIYGRGEGWAVLGVGVMVAILLAASLGFRESSGAIVAVAGSLLLPLLVLGCVVFRSDVTTERTIACMAVALLLFGLTRTLGRFGALVGGADSSGPSGTPRFAAGVFLSWFWTVSGAGLALFLLARGGLFPGTLITVAWGGLGLLLLAGGFVLVDRVWRFVSLGIFGAAILRIFLHDLTGSTMFTKAIAFLGVGILLVAASLIYGVLRSRLAGGPPARPGAGSGS